MLKNIFGDSKEKRVFICRKTPNDGGGEVICGSMFTQLPGGFTDAWKRVQPCPEQIILPTPESINKKNIKKVFFTRKKEKVFRSANRW